MDGTNMKRLGVERKREKAEENNSQCKAVPLRQRITT